MIKSKPILVLDFDGVLHSYTSGAQGADVANDPPVDGAREFCEAALEAFNVIIVSARCNQKGGSTAIVKWLDFYGFPEEVQVSMYGTKPPAHVTLDDRAVTFTGTFPTVESLKSFKPWNKK